MLVKISGQFTVCALAATMWVGSHANADVLVEAPSADTWVGVHTGGSIDFGNQNGATMLEAQGDFGSDSRQGRILLQYDVSSIAAGATITSATLTIRNGVYYNLTGSAQAATVELRHIVEGNPWTEGGATWQTYDGTNAWSQTGVGGVGGGGDLAGTGAWVSSTVIDSFTTPAAPAVPGEIGAPIDLDITALVQSWVAGTLENNGLSLQMASGFDGNSFLILIPNSESAAVDTTPIITVEYTIPEPTSLGLVGLGALTMLPRRRHL